MSFEVPGYSAPDNKFSLSPSFGGQAQYPANDNAKELVGDSSEVHNPNQGEQGNMDMALAPNMFPRETGHDSLTDEEAQLT